MYLRAKQKRQAAKYCLYFALKGNFKKASRIRQKLYAVYPPGSIGTDWTNSDAIWHSDEKYLSFLQQEDFTDLENTLEFINAVKAGLFVDMLFGFQDSWSVLQAVHICSERKKDHGELPEEICCPLLSEFFTRMRWPKENFLIVYSNTKKKNIQARENDASEVKSSNFTPRLFQKGEYDLGFWPGTSQRVIEARQQWLERYNLFEAMKAAGVPGCPKTYKTFEKHCLANDEKYQAWEAAYNALL